MINKVLYVFVAMRVYILCLFSALLFTAAFIARPAAASPEVTGRIAELLESDQNLALPIRQRMDVLKAYYVEGQGGLLWIGTGRLRDFLATLQNAQDHGLKPKDYPIGYLAKLFNVSANADATSQAVIELVSSAFFLNFVSDLKVGRLLPSKIAPELYWKTKTFNSEAALRGLFETGTFAAFLDKWQPQIPEYLALRRALGIYRQLAVKGGWPVLDAGPVLKPGMQDPRIPVLRARLAATDGAPALLEGADETLYDATLQKALAQFQKRHGLEPDGVLGNRTLFQLNISVDQRIEQIIANMERWRWMPEQLGNHYIIVNIAGFELKRVRAGKVEEHMRVVVGQPFHRTPVFSKNMKYVELNPYWNVPSSIAVKEELPKLKADPASLAAKGFEAVSGEQAFDVRSINWAQYSPSNLPFRLRQRPGPSNALGRVKFMFPNRFNIYLHDTPARSLFAKAKRAFSHGCIRLARPIDLAQQVLAGEKGWSRGRIDQVLASQERTVVNLSQPIPVHITYATAWRDGTGNIRFAADIYNRDDALLRALFGRPTPSS